MLFVLNLLETVMLLSKFTSIGENGNPLDNVHVSSSNHPLVNGSGKCPCL